MDEPIATELKTVYPKFDLGQWRNFEGTNLFLYATIERPGVAECRGVWPVTEKRMALCFWRSHT